MAWRVTEREVREIIPNDPLVSFKPFIDGANALTDHVSSQDSQNLLNSALLVQIEKNLAAYLYEARDPQYDEKKTGDAMAVFQGEWGTGLTRNSWGQNALMYDVTGELRKISKGVVRVSMEWLGLAESDQTDYADRN